MDNSTPDMPEKLVRYLDGELNEDEKKIIEQQLNSDSVLQQEYNSLLATREAIRHYGLQQQVDAVHQHMMGEFQVPVKKIGSKRRIIRNAVAIAASVLLLVAGYAAFNFFTLSPEKVFNSNFRVFELTTVRSDGAGETAAEKAYREKNYKEVIRIHDAGEDHTRKGEFLCGVAALELKDNKKAITCFTEVLEQNKQATVPILNDETEYYLFLSYIRDRNYNAAIAIMEKIKDDPGHLYHKKVTSKLIRQVKLLRWR
ncbi:MAG TPA: hypothetical protein PLG08_10230 [Chitinophagaceae bacterium]|nr:hypothetical protein [Chitinophagaceae bacterium]